VPDYNRIAEQSRLRAEAEVKAVADKLAAGKELPPSPEKPAQDGFKVEFDWRGESAYCIEPDRRLWLFAAYWGGTGSLEHIHATWEYQDGRRIALTPDERRETLRRVLAAIEAGEGFPMRCRELEETGS